MKRIITPDSKTVVIDVMVDDGDKFYGQLTFPKRPWGITADELLDLLHKRFPTLAGRTDVVLETL